jgi:uncharacterized membrane protein YfcA
MTLMQQRSGVLIGLLCCTVVLCASKWTGEGTVDPIILRLHHRIQDLDVVRAGRRLLSEQLDNQSDLVMNWRTGLAIPLYLILSALAVSSGVGGGLFWVPLFTALMQFSVKSAAALSQSCVAGGCLGGTLYSIMQRNPIFDSRPMIDYSLTLVLMPALVLGINIGVMLNYILPALIISSILLVLLLLISFRTLQQGIKMIRAERKIKKKSTQRVSVDASSIDVVEQAPSPISSESGMDTTLNGCSSGNNSPVTVMKDSDRSSFEGSLEERFSVTDRNAVMAVDTQQTAFHGKLRSASRAISRKVTRVIGRIQKPLIPWIYFLEIIAIAGVFLGLQIGKSFYHKCSWEVWTMFGVQVALMIACSAIFIWFHEHEAPIKHSHHTAQIALSNEEREDEEGEEEDDDWKPSKLALIWLLTLILGTLSGTVGLGGGVLMSPLLLELHVHPQTAAATSTFMTLFASTTATVSFGLDDRLNLQYMALYAPLCCVGGFFGVFILTGLIRKYKFTSVVSLMVGTLVFVSAILLICFALRESIEDIVNGQPLEVEDLCTVT